MKMFFYFISLFLFFIFTATISHAQTEWTEISKGVEFKKITQNFQNKNTILNVIKIQQQHVTIKPVYFPGETHTAKKMTEKSGALALINANFFDTKSEPLGLVIKDKKELHPFKNISWWSILCFSRGQTKIIHSSQFQNQKCEQAIQAGPRLVVNGQVPKLKDESSRKTAIGINQKGELFFVVSEQPLPIKALAQVFQKPEKSGGLGCVQAINLDGGSSSQMFIQTKKLQLHVPSFIQFPVGIGIFKK